MKIYMETERMILREFTRDDVGNLVDLDSDPQVTRYINGGLPSSREYVQNKVMPRIMAYYAELDRQGIWAVESKDTREFLGWFHLRPYGSAPEETELGYRFKRKVWGQGLATEGSLALVKRGFEELGASIVVAIADPENGASRRVMEKVGMTHLGDLQESDGFIVVKYGLTSEDYFRGKQ